MWDIVVQIFPYAIAYTVPMLITALGALYCERSGIVNIGLDGFMIVGSFAGALTISQLQEAGVSGALWIGLLVAAIVGALFSLLHAFASINLNADQVISGTAINMMAGALTVFLARNITGSGNIRITLGFLPKSIPVLKDIPIIGPLLFTKTYITTWIVLAILIPLTILLFIFVLIQLPYLLKRKFYPSFSAFTFPLVICAIAFQKTGIYYQIAEFSILNILIHLTELLAIIIVIYVWYGFIKNLFYSN